MGHVLHKMRILPHVVFAGSQQVELKFISNGPNRKEQGENKKLNKY